MTQRLRAFLFALAIAVLAPLSGAEACVGCRQVGDGVAKVEPQTIQAGFALSWSVLFMLATVIGVLTFLGFFIARTVARLDRTHSGQP
jgi:hypothetical protein